MLFREIDRPAPDQGDDRVRFIALFHRPFDLNGIRAIDHDDLWGRVDMIERVHDRAFLGEDHAVVVSQILLHGD